MNLLTPINKINGVGPAHARRLERLGIREVKDLLFHFPSRYEDFSKITLIKNIEIGKNVSVIGKVLSIKNTKTYRKRMSLTEAIAEDESGAIKIVWFNQPYIADTLIPGIWASFSGKISLSGDSLIISSPAYEIIGSNERVNKEFGDLKHTARLVPIYPETAGISSRWFRYIIKPLLKMAGSVPEHLPEDILKRQNISPISVALKDIHFPANMEDAERARKRIAFGELFLMQIVTLKERLALKSVSAPKIKFDLALAKEFVSSLPFKLTDSQRKSAWEILRDLQKPYPMNRLLEGDVGSGKTVVAAMAILQAIKSGYQVALMVPTEILAEQHFRGLAQFLDPHKITVAILTSSAHKKTSQKVKYEPFKISKNRVAKETAEGKIDIVIGTHSLIRETVQFKNLGLIVIDEQHRFGVSQRAALVRGKTRNLTRKNAELQRNSALDSTSFSEQMRIPHLLSMTATPIPRTLSLAIYGDLDLSLIKQMPVGRKQIATKIVAPAGRTGVYRFIEKEVAAGRQAFVICPLIDESEKLEAKAAKQEYERLQSAIFPKLKISLMHGKIKGKEKEKIMQDFRSGESDILVSTSVVEVGIDVPNASVMLIEGADRFGLAQLYQFKGRVGRAEHQSYCFLFSDSTAKTTRQRLRAIEKAKNSFELAEEDLKIRGPGDFMGSRQHGMPSLAMASLSDMEFIKEARKEARELLDDDPDIKKNTLLRERYEQFRTEIHFE